MQEGSLHFIIVEVPPLLDESDLHIAQYTLVILRSVALYHPNALANLPTTAFPQIDSLVKSPLLQGMENKLYCVQMKLYEVFQALL